MYVDKRQFVHEHFAEIREDNVTVKCDPLNPGDPREGQRAEQASKSKHLIS